MHRLFPVAQRRHLGALFALAGSATFGCSFEPNANSSQDRGVLGQEQTSLPDDSSGSSTTIPESSGDSDAEEQTSSVDASTTPESTLGDTSSTDDSTSISDETSTASMSDSTSEQTTSEGSDDGESFPLRLALGAEGEWSLLPDDLEPCAAPDGVVGDGGPAIAVPRRRVHRDGIEMPSSTPLQIGDELSISHMFKAASCPLAGGKLHSWLTIDGQTQTFDQAFSCDISNVPSQQGITLMLHVSRISSTASIEYGVDLEDVCGEITHLLETVAIGK
jgi:hypothetical protein